MEALELLETAKFSFRLTIPELLLLYVEELL